MSEYLEYFKSSKGKNELTEHFDEKEIVASCFSILDESARKILSARYVEKLSFEQIAVRLEYSNPIIAQFEFNKAFNQFENISRARLNIISN